MNARRLAVALLVVLVGAILLRPVALAQGELGPTLAEIVKRDRLNCGVVEQPGFAEPDGAGGWRGFDVDFCRALAAAIFDDPAKTTIIKLPARERLSPLLGGWVDVLASSAPWTLARDAAQRALYAGVSFYDGQGFMVLRARSLASAQDLAGVSVCVKSASSQELALADYFHARNAPFETHGFPTDEAAAAAYAAGQCDALSDDAAQLYATRTRLAQPAEHDILSGFISRSPRGPVVRRGDDQWFALVRWTLGAMIDAEELGVSKAGVDEALTSQNTDIRRLLGVEGDAGAGLGLRADWAYRVIKHVGNYADVFDKNLGSASALGMDRRYNALWSKGGLLYAPPMR
jgi:general L-amino acid transport system substrate-binding protein